MTQREDNQTPPPEGGHAAERLRQFERSRAKPKCEEESEEDKHPECAEHEPPTNQDSTDEPGKGKSST